MPANVPLSVFAQPLRQLRAGAAHVQQRVVQVGDGRRHGGVRQRVVGDAGFGIGLDERGIEVGLLDRRSAPA